MPYSVKTIYLTIQGEGAQAGRPAVFLRFAGCNLWSGREDQRSGAICDFCDTDFLGTDGPAGGQYATAQELADAVHAQWRARAGHGGTPLAVCTGGEPLLQLDEAMIDALHACGFEVAVESNGTRVPPRGIDWLCISPKAGAELVVREGDEMKLVYPQAGAVPELFESMDFKYFFLQPLDGPDREANTRRVVEYCLAHPKWRVGLQLQKILNIP